MASLRKRGKTYYAQFYVGTTQKRVSLGTSSYKIAKAKLTKIESKLVKGDDSPLPTKTPLAKAVQSYLDHMQAVKVPASVQRDADILRMVFGPIVPDLEQIGCKKVRRKWQRSEKSKQQQQEERQRIRPRIEAVHVEGITTAMVSDFIDTSVRQRGLAPRTANRYREVLNRLFNWSMKQGGIRMPSDKNPVAQVERYRQKAPEIRFLTLRQINEQLEAMQDDPQCQAMVAMYIYAGLRREEALWLRLEDINLTAGKQGMIRIQAKTVDGEYWQSKTGVNRAIPISSTLRHYLERYTPRPSIGGWYFPSPEGYRYDCDNFSKALSRLNKQAGLRWTCLDFRHTFGSQLAMKGESLYKISKLMGNSPDICRTHYAALISEELGDSVEFHQVETPYRIHA